MINIIVCLALGLILGCWIVTVMDNQVKDRYKFIITVAVACLFYIVNGEYEISGIAAVMLVLGSVATVISIALCRAAKDGDK